MVALGKEHYEAIRKARDLHPDAEWYFDCQLKAKYSGENKPTWHYAAEAVGPVNCVYFVRMGNTTAVKIGFSDSFAVRFSDLQVASPVELKIDGFVSFWKAKAAKKAEKKAFQFALLCGGRHLRGEWYDLEREQSQKTWRALIEWAGENMMGAYHSVG